MYNGSLIVFGGLNDDGGFYGEPFIPEIDESRKMPHLVTPVFQHTVEMLDAKKGWNLVGHMRMEDARGDFALVKVN